LYISEAAEKHCGLQSLQTASPHISMVRLVKLLHQQNNTKRHEHMQYLGTDNMEIEIRKRRFLLK
jgi:hypothetical protein